MVENIYIKVQTHYRILLSNKWTMDIQNILDESPGNYAVQRKNKTKTQNNPSTLI